MLNSIYLVSNCSLVDDNRYSVRVCLLQGRCCLDFSSVPPLECVLASAMTAVSQPWRGKNGQKKAGVVWGCGWLSLTLAPFSMVSSVSRMMGAIYTNTVSYRVVSSRGGGLSQPAEGRQDASVQWERFTPILPCNETSAPWPQASLSSGCFRRPRHHQPTTKLELMEWS